MRNNRFNPLLPVLIVALFSIFGKFGIADEKPAEAAKKTKELVRPTEKDGPDIKEEYQRQARHLRALCTEERFPSLALIDSAADLSEKEKIACKARLHAINPLLE